MITKKLLSLRLPLLLATMATTAYGQTTAGELGASCLVTCQALNGQPTLMSELGMNDRCVGYLKAVAGSLEWFNGTNPKRIDVGSCTAKLLADRTATRPQDDEVLAQACALGKWLSNRPSMSQRPAAETLIGWMKISRCE